MAELSDKICIMKKQLVRLIQGYFRTIFKAELVRRKDLEILQIDSQRYRDLLRWQKNPISADLYSYISKNMEKSKSQLQQDLFANYLMQSLDSNDNNYFVEFGCTDGVKISNTFLLEKEFGWTGIVVEPARVWHKDLLLNRNCKIDFACVYGSTGLNLEFIESKEAEYSTLYSYENGDYHKRIIANRYMVQTISLNDLLIKYDAPRKINYLSIDTEGSEYEILKNFDFLDYSFDFISVEHNFGINRDDVRILLETHGYVRIFSEVSVFEDWFIAHNIATQLDFI